MVPDVITHNALISACEKGEQPERALEVFVLLEQQGLVPDFITYDALISTCKKGKWPKRAQACGQAAR